MKSEIEVYEALMTKEKNKTNINQKTIDHQQGILDDKIQEKDDAVAKLQEIQVKQTV